MTFRGRLRLFFAIIVIVPMAAVAVVLFSLTADSERGKADAGLATALSVAFSLYADGRRAAGDELRAIAADDRLGAALRRGRGGTGSRKAAARLRALVRRDPAVVSATLFDSTGELLVRAGSNRGVAPAAALLTRRRGGLAARLAVSVTDGRELAQSVRRRTRLEAVIMRQGRRVASSTHVETVPAGSSDFEVDGREYRARREQAGQVAGVTEEIAVLRRAEATRSAIAESRLIVVGIIAAILLIALGSSILVGRALQGQIGQFLQAARRLARGRFDQPVPTEGRDEFAELGREFNSMSEQLAAKMEEVERKRRELEETIRRVGKAIATGLDRQGIFELTVQTAVDACAAQRGRGVPLDARLLAKTGSGSDDDELRAALEEAERQAVSVGPDTGRELLEEPVGAAAEPDRREAAAVKCGGAHALAVPLRARLGAGSHAHYIGLISIARRELPFTREEAELLEYLAGQAAVSIENADLHETVQRQAVTDELTGLANLREMHGALDREFERGQRFDTPVGFVLLDIDDFKQVNDTYGHQQGDAVLRHVAGVLHDHSREIDEPARYGGEELAVVLPQTEIDGAAMLAERIRTAVAELRIPLVTGGGDMAVTASFGVASVPTSASEKSSLIATADSALYRAKRSGKNRVERADPVTV